jgi:putative membrane protein
MMWNGNGMSGWGYTFMGLTTLALWLALIVAVVVLVQGTQRVRSTGPGESASGAEQVLAMRYARGEIDDDEYQRRLTSLRSTRPGPSG